MVKHDVNGWQILQKYVESNPENRRIFDRMFGDDFDCGLLADGGHLLSIDNARELAGELKMSSRNREEFYNRIIISRSNAKCEYHLEEFKQDACELANKNMGEIPCAEIDILWHFQPLYETLHGFMKRVAIASYPVNCPSGCCAFLVTKCRMTAALNVPEGSMIIVNGTKPAMQDELALFQCRNRRLFCGKSDEVDPGRIKWTAPVIELRFSSLPQFPAR